MSKTSRMWIQRKGSTSFKMEDTMSAFSGYQAPKVSPSVVGGPPPQSSKAFQVTLEGTTQRGRPWMPRFPILERALADAEVEHERWPLDSGGLLPVMLEEKKRPDHGCGQKSTDGKTWTSGNLFWKNVLATPEACGNLSSLKRDWTRTPCI